MEEVKLKATNSQKHITQIASNLSPEKKDKLAKAAREFESLLTAQMIKSMYKANGGMFGENSYGGDTYDLLFEMELAKKFSSSKSLGIANAIYKKITGEDLPEDIKINFVRKNKEVVNDNFPNSEKQVKSSERISSSSVVKPSEESLRRLDKYEAIIKEASRKFGVSERLIKAIILAESAGNPYAVSPKNAKGLMQLMDGTAEEMGVKNPFDPRENIFGGTKYFAQLLKMYDGNEDLALAAYNAGPGNVARFKGVPPFAETKNYIVRVNAYANFFEENEL